jgi:hypothetical protein
VHPREARGLSTVTASEVGDAWICAACGAPFANRDASHSCVQVDVERHFADASPAIRAAFDRLVELATADGPIPVVAQKTRIVLAAPMRFLAVTVHRDRLGGHLLLDRPVPHPVVSQIVPDAYGSGLYLHRLAIRTPAELDAAFAAIVREAAERVGRRTRLRDPAATAR